MKLLILIAVIKALVSCGDVRAEAMDLLNKKWTHVTSSISGDKKVYVGQARKSNRPNIKVVWWAITNESGGATVALSNFDCGQDLQQDIESIDYDVEGTPILRRGLSKIGPVYPGSMGEHVLNYVCSKGLSARDKQTLRKQVEEFSKNPKYKKFPLVRDQMADLLESGRAKSLEEAYNIAIGNMDEESI